VIPQTQSKISSNMEPKSAEKRRAENINRNMEFQMQLEIINGTSSKGPFTK